MAKAFDFSEPPFNRLRPPEIARVEAAVDIGFYRPGTVVLKAGAVPDHYFVVIKGIVEERDGREAVSAHGQGDGFDAQILLHQACRYSGHPL